MVHRGILFVGDHGAVEADQMECNVVRFKVLGRVPPECIVDSFL